MGLNSKDSVVVVKEEVVEVSKESGIFFYKFFELILCTSFYKFEVIYVLWISLFLMGGIYCMCCSMLNLQKGMIL